MDKDFLRMMASAMSDDEPQLSKEEQLEKINAFIEAANQPCPFKVGDVVTQKSGDVKAYKNPKPGNPAVVIEVFENTSYPKDTGGTTAHKNDMAICIITQGTPDVYPVESFRFKPYKA